MSNFSNYGGLKSSTGSVGGGGDGNNHRDDRGIFFPEFDQWAQNEGAILKASTRAKLDKDNGISETITIDINFNDDAWRPSSTVLAYSGLPKIGSEHPTISNCILKDVSIQSYNNQHDHFRATLDYAFEELSTLSLGGSENKTPLDEPFIITWSPTINKQFLDEDLDGTALRNPNGELYESYVNKVRLDGTCTWNQRSWDAVEGNKWTGVINSNTWTNDDYKFEKETVLCNYVIGNLKFYTDEDGQRVPYYAMQAGISFNPEGWTAKGNNVAAGSIKIRRSGSFYYTNSAKKENQKRPLPKDKFQYQSYDLDKDGVLLSKKPSQPTSSTPEYDYFRMYELVNFNFVDR